MLDAAAARGYPIKVVLFASEEDTGGDPGPLEDTQDYAATVSDQLTATGPLRAPVLIVTPRALGLGGKQPRGGRLVPITPALARGLPLAKKAEGNALAGAAMVAVRRLAAAGGHPLPKRIPPAEQNLNGILGRAAAQDGGSLGPGLIAVMLVGTVLLGALLVGVHRRVAREPDRRARPA